MTVAVRRPSRMVFPITVGSLLSAVDQKRYVSTATPSAFGPSSLALIRRPMTGWSPMTSKKAPDTTPARTCRGSPRPTIVKPMVEKSPIAVSDFTRDLRSMISGTENAAFSAPMPGALCRM